MSDGDLDSAMCAGGNKEEAKELLGLTDTPSYASVGALLSPPNCAFETPKPTSPRNTLAADPFYHEM